MEAFILYSIYASLIYLPINFLLTEGAIRLFKLKSNWKFISGWKFALSYAILIAFLVGIRNVSNFAYASEVIILISIFFFVFSHKEKKLKVGSIGFVLILLALYVHTLILWAVFIRPILANFPEAVANETNYISIRDLFNK